MFFFGFDSSDESGENKELDFIVLNEGLLITPEKKSRAGWQIDKEKEKPKVAWEWWKN